MSEVLKGNFRPRKPVNVEQSEEGDLSRRFEREALKRLGGSIAFVAKRKFIYGNEDDGRASGAPRA